MFSINAEMLRCALHDRFEFFTASEAIVRTLAMMAYIPAIGRVLSKGGVMQFEDLMWETVPRLYDVQTSRDDFDKLLDTLLHRRTASTASQPTLRRRARRRGVAEKRQKPVRKRHRSANPALSVMTHPRPAVNATKLTRELQRRRKQTRLVQSQRPVSSTRVSTARTKPPISCGARVFSSTNITPP